MGVEKARVENEEDVVDREAAQQVQEEPGLHVLHLKKEIRIIMRTRPSKQCKSLIEIEIIEISILIFFFSFLICYRGEGKLMVTPTNRANIV